MLSDRERRMLAQIEAHIRREEPALAHFLTHASRRTLRHPGRVTLRALMLTVMTMAVGVAVFVVGAASQVPPLVVAGLALAMVGPLPVWLLATSEWQPIRARG